MTLKVAYKISDFPIFDSCYSVKYMMAVCFMAFIHCKNIWLWTIWSSFRYICHYILYQPDPGYEKKFGTHPFLYKIDMHFNNSFEKDFPSITELQAFISASFP